MRDGQWLSTSLVLSAVTCMALAGLLVFGLIPATHHAEIANERRDVQVSAVRLSLGGAANEQREYFLAGDPAFLETFDEERRDAETSFRWLRTNAPSDVRATVAEAVVSYQTFLTTHTEAVRLFQSGDRVAGTALMLTQDLDSPTAVQAKLARAAEQLKVHDEAITDGQDDLSHLSVWCSSSLGLGLLATARSSSDASTRIGQTPTPSVPPWLSSGRKPESSVIRHCTMHSLDCRIGR